MPRSVHSFLRAALGVAVILAFGPSTATAGMQLLLDCPGQGTETQPAADRGLRFVAPGPFSLVDVRMTATSFGLYSFDVRLRRSTGFTDVVESSVGGLRVIAPGDLRWRRVRIDLGLIAATPGEVFTLEFANVVGPGSLLLETFQTGSDPCLGLEVTADDQAANPPALADPAGFKVLRRTPDMYRVSASLAAEPPIVDGRITPREWPMAEVLSLPHGFLVARNDAGSLYLLIDLPGDDNDDPMTLDDTLELTVDVDQDGAITAGVDLHFRISAEGNLRYAYYEGAGSWTALQDTTLSARAKGFGCFVDDGSRSIEIDPYAEQCAPHRVWELSVDLDEIGAVAGDTVRVGLRTASVTPMFVDSVPSDFTLDFENLISVRLARGKGPTLIRALGPDVHFESDPIEITQAIQSRDNLEPLVQDKDTVGRVYAYGAGGLVNVYLYAERGGVDLDGSPRRETRELPSSINRLNLNDTTNFALPDSWPAGGVSFWAKVRDFLDTSFGGSAATAGTTDVTFTERGVPDVWVIPVNGGTDSSPALPSDADLAAIEDEMATLYPVAEIDFTRKDWRDLGALDTSSLSSALSSVKVYYAVLLASWAASGGSTALPDQIFGALDPSIGGGTSDPTWFDGFGTVAVGSLSSACGPCVMSHELNHNWDKSLAGVWGRHVDGCGATGSDPNWPYADDSINEVGFDTRLPWSDGSSGVFTVVPDTFPDIMSYCTSGATPRKWISPYRWENLFANTSPSSYPAASLTSDSSASTKSLTAETIQPVYFVRGRLFSSGGGDLAPVSVMSGVPTTPIAPGPYRIEVLGPGGVIDLTRTFSASFVDVEGNPLTSVEFLFFLPAASPATVTSIRLMHGPMMLDQIGVSPGAPAVNVTSPNGGESLDGPFTVTWAAGDPDGDMLHFQLWYSADGGSTWTPVARDLTTTSYDGDTSTMPGSANGRFRVIASDGFRTVRDDSDAAFSVAKNAPSAWIIRPQPLASAWSGETVRFMGRASDKEESVIPDAGYLWVESDQVFATGRDVTAVFPPGNHTITLTVIDADGMTGSATVDVDVTARCDGPGDPDFPELGTSCAAGVGACQAVGIVLCAPDGLGTVCSATPNTPVPETCDGIDNDCDGSVDEDGDGDGADVCVDCNDADPASWSTPGEVIDLRFVDATTLSWTGPSSPGGSGIVYDTLRSGAADDFAGAVCLETDDGSDTAALDLGNPVAGMAFHYLVRAQNACPGAAGEGSLGAATGGGFRPGVSCP